MKIFAAYCDKANPWIDKKQMFAAMVADRFNKKQIDELTEEEWKELFKIVLWISEAYDKQIAEAVVSPIAEQSIIEEPIVEEPVARDIDEIIAWPATTSQTELTAEQVAELPF